MKLLLRRNVHNLGHIGEVVEVKTGYGRNYLIPQGLAVAPTEANLKAIEAQKQAYLEELAREKAALEARASLLEGKEFAIAARANPEGQLYGSVGPAQIALAVAKEGLPIDARNIVLDEPIRKLDKYQVTVRFAEDVKATISVWVVPLHESEDGQAEDSADGAESGSSADDEAPSEQEAPESPSEETGEPGR
jgi:large subunit ribosomal protein L9